MKSIVSASALAAFFVMTTSAHAVLLGNKKTTPVKETTTTVKQTTTVTKPVFGTNCKGNDPAKLDLTKPFPKSLMAGLSNTDQTDLIAIAKEQKSLESINFLKAVDKLRENLGQNGWARVFTDFVAGDRVNFTGSVKCWATFYNNKLKKAEIKASDDGIRGSLRSLYTDASTNLADIIDRLAGFQEARRLKNANLKLNNSKMIKQIESGEIEGGASQLMKKVDLGKLNTKPTTKTKVIPKKVTTQKSE